MLVILLPLLLILSIECLGLAQEPVGSVTELEGTAKLSRGKQQFNVVIKMPVIVHDRLQTMSKSHLTVTLRGGSQLMLAESSTMVIDDVAANARRFNHQLDGGPRQSRSLFHYGRHHLQF